MCFAALALLEQLWVEFVAWWRPTHALSRCSEVSAGQAARGREAQASTTVATISDSANYRTSDSIGQWTWRKRFQVAGVGMVISVLATSQGQQN